MENLLYKYSKFYGFSYFQQCCFRISSPFNQNDPFEAFPSVNWMVKMRSNEGQLAGLNDEMIKDRFLSFKTRENMRKHYAAPFDDCGIISFSETNDNLLMWSHYAECHSGVVIGIDPTHQYFNRHNANHPFYGKIHRVKYRKHRVEKFDSFLEPIITKSDEWMYEKEHRYIMKIFDADRLIIETKTLDEYNQEHPYSKIIDIKSGNSNKLEISPSSHHAAKLHRKNKGNFFCDLPKEAIKYIGFGADFDPENLQKCLDIIISEWEGCEILVEKFETSLYNFELDKRTLYTNAVSSDLH